MGLQEVAQRTFSAVLSPCLAGGNTETASPFQHEVAFGPLRRNSIETCSLYKSVSQCLIEWLLVNLLSTIAPGASRYPGQSAISNRLLK